LFVFLLAACSGPGGETASPAFIAHTPVPLPATSPSPAQASPLAAAKPPADMGLPTSPPLIQPVSQVTGFPDPGAYTWQPVASGLSEPVGLSNAADGSGRLFVLEKRGLVRIIQNGAMLPTPFLDISDHVGSRPSEQGLLGLAFHPRYQENGLFYVDYTDSGGNTVVARFQVSKQDPNQADRNSESRVLFISQPYPNHKGGQLAFGPDGCLYIGMGDGGSEGDPLRTGQNLNILLGKILRIDVDQKQPYAIPADNPFAKGGGLPEIWAYGLRNPWRFSFDRQTGDLYIADVGQDMWEEIDFSPVKSPGGANFGWSYMEGNHPYNGAPPAGLKLVPPVAEYSHNFGCAVIGGAVYRGSQMPAWQGIYLFGDYCSGNVWGLFRNAQGSWTDKLLFTSLGKISSFGEEESGEIVVAFLNGAIYRLAVK
jgi:glucose/arabinose dehydrogenase